MNFFHFFANFTDKNGSIENTRNVLNNISTLIKRKEEDSDVESFYSNQEILEELFKRWKEDAQDDCLTSRLPFLMKEMVKAWNNQSIETDPQNLKDFLLIDGENYSPIERHSYFTNRKIANQRETSISEANLWRRRNNDNEATASLHAKAVFYQKGSLIPQFKEPRVRQYNSFARTKVNAFINLKAIKETLRTTTINLDSHQGLIEEGFLCWITKPTDWIEDFQEFSGELPLFNFLERSIHVLEKRSRGEHVDLLPREEEMLQSLPETYKVIVLALTSEERQEYLSLLSQLTLNNYTKQNLVGTYNGKNVYSFFSKGFYELFSKYGDVSTDTNLFAPEMDPISFTPVRPEVSMLRNTNHHNFATKVQRSIFNPSFKPEDTPYIPLGLGCGLTFLTNDTTLLSFKTQVENLNQRRMVGLIMNSFTRNSEKDNFEIVSFTKRQARTRKGFFIPTLFPIEYRDENFNIVQGYSFSLLNLSSDNEMVEKKTRSQDEIVKFGNAYKDIDGMYFFNKEEYNRRVQEKLKELLQYTKTNTYWLSLDSTELGTLAEMNKEVHEKVQQKIDSADSRVFDALTVEPKINAALKKRYTKVKNHYDALTKKKEAHDIEWRSHSQGLAQTSIHIQSEYKIIKKAKAAIAQHEAASKQKQARILEVIKEQGELIETLNLNRKLYENITKRYTDAIATANEELSVTSSGFFKNIFEEGIIIISATFEINTVHKGKKVSKEIILCSESSKEHRKLIFQNKTKFKIKKVEFIINKPVPIKVDSGKKPTIYGGPYNIKVEPNSLKISLAYPNSAYGFNERRVKVHPHTSGSSREQRHDSSLPFTNACLGEASPLLYSAFQKNDLKLIVMAALLWVKNANSADTWGKEYTLFPQEKDMNEKYIVQNNPIDSKKQNITEDEVEDFIQEMLVETPTEAPPTFIERAEQVTEALPAEAEAEPLDGAILAPPAEEYVRFTETN